MSRPPPGRRRRWWARAALPLALAWLAGGVLAADAASAQGSGTLWSTVLQVLGISANPGSLKGGGGVDAGELWISDWRGGARRRVGPGNAYRSPLFVPKGDDLLVLKGDELVLLVAPQGQERRLATLPGVTRLVGFVGGDAERVLVLASPGGGPARAWTVALARGGITPLDYDPRSSRDQSLVERLQDERRSYPGLELYVQRVRASSLAGPEEWSDVFLARSGREPVDVSLCHPVDCGQPALSADGARVVYVRKVEE